MRKDRTYEVYGDEDEEYSSEGQLATEKILIELIDMWIFLEPICCKSHDEKERKVYDYTIPDDPKGTNHEDESIDSHEHQYLFEFAIGFGLFEKKVYSRQESNIHEKHDEVSETIVDSDSAQKCSKSRGGRRKKIIESEENKTTSCNIGEYIFPWSDKKKKGRN